MPTDQIRGLKAHGSSPAMTKEESAYPTVSTAGARSGWAFSPRQAKARFLSSAGLSQRYCEIAAKFLCEIDRYPGVDAALAIQEFGMVFERHDRAVPDIRMDVQPAAAVTAKSDKLLRSYVITRQR